MRLLSCIAMMVAAMALSLPAASALLTNGPSGHALSSSLKVFGNVSVVDAAGSTKDLLSIIEQQAVLIDSLTSQLAVRSALWSSTISPVMVEQVQTSATYYDHPYLQSWTVPAAGTYDIDIQVRMYTTSAQGYSWNCFALAGSRILQGGYISVAPNVSFDYMTHLRWKGQLAAGEVVKPQCRWAAAGGSQTLAFTGTNDGNGWSTFTAHRLF